MTTAAYYAQHSDKVREDNRRYAASHPDKVKKWKRNYREKHREELRSKAKADPNAKKRKRKYYARHSGRLNKSQAARNYDARLRRDFNITPAERDKMEALQGGLCEICGCGETTKRGGKIRRLSVDHDHSTGSFRGLICNRCNTTLGKVLDDPGLLRKMACYLERDYE